MPLQGQPVLILDATSDAFVQALVDALVGVEAEPIIAANDPEALEHLERYEFSAALISEPTQFDKSMIDALGGLPVVLFGRPGDVAGTDPPSVTVKRDIPSVIAALNAAFSEG